MSLLPIASPKFSIAFCAFWSLPARFVPAASALPPNSFSSSARISACAPAISFIAIICLIVSFCDSVKLTPTRRKASKPLSGSCSALPNWIAVPCRSIADVSPCAKATAISCMARVARGNTSPPILVNVSSMFCPD